MKTPEDEAFEELAKRQGDWGGGYQAKRKMAANKLWDKPSVAFDEWWNSDYDESTNPFRLKSGAYWAWAGWKAALAQPAQELKIKSWGETHPRNPSATCVCEHWQSCVECRPTAQEPAQEPWNEAEWRRNNWRCGHGWLRGEQCEICNAPQPAHCQCIACKDGILHASDCAVHNGPAYPAGPCDCGVAQEKNA